MNSKNRKYYIYIKIFDFFFKQSNNIFLFVHVNNMSNLESKIISSYCITNKICNLNVKANLYNKIFRNLIFLNILSGPTRIFSFENFFSFVFFFKHVNVKKIFIPLIIFWNNNFYNYKYFYNYVSNFFFKRSIFLDNIKQNNYLKYNWFLEYTRQIFIFNFLKILNKKVIIEKKIIDEINLNCFSFFFFNWINNYNFIYINYYESNIFKKFMFVSCLDKSVVKPLTNVVDVNYYEK